MPQPPVPLLTNIDDGGQELASFTDTALGHGAHTITATYSGDFYLAASAATPLVQDVVTQRLPPTTTTLTSSAQPASSGQAVTFTATVTPSSGSGMPTGTVTFTVDGTPQVPVTLSEVGGHAIASLTDSSLALGTHTITASYGGDSRFALSAAQSLTQVVGPITEIPISAPAADITSGPDGNLWYTVETDNEIGMIDPATGAVSEFAVPTPNSDLTNITTGSDGNLWFVEASVDQIGNINSATHAISEFSVPIPSIVTIPDLAPGPDGTLWLIVLAGNADSATRLGSST